MGAGNRFGLDDSMPLRDAHSHAIRRRELAQEPGRGMPIDSGDYLDRGRASIGIATAEAVTSKVETVYLAGVKRCHRNALRIDHSIAGEITVMFEVDDAGRARSVEVSAPTPGLHACILRGVATWRFPVPRGTERQSTAADHDFRFTIFPG